jgi:hypothetical protein
MDGSAFSIKRLVLPASTGLPKIGTTTAADFWEREPSHLGRPAFQPMMLTHGYVLRSPQIRT